MQAKCYSRNPITKRHSAKHIVVLTKNYRSHPSILNVPNSLFYEGMLEAVGNSGKEHAY